MSHRLWLLVEWVDEREFFPNYGVVNVGSLIGNETQLHVGKLIFVRDKHGNNTRRAQVLRISDDKNFIKEQKRLMEKDDRQVKNVLSLCMRQIAELKSTQMQFGLIGANAQSSSRSNTGGTMTMPQVVADSEDTSGESEAETHYDIGRRHNLNTSTVPQNHDPLPREASSNVRSGNIQTPGFTGRFMICSTPISTINQYSSHKPKPPISVKISQTIPPLCNASTSNQANATPVLTFDQGTQTDSALTFYSPTARRSYTKEEIEQMEEVARALYKRFLSLVAQLNTFRRRPLSLTMYPANDSVSMSDNTEPMESEPEHGARSSPEQDVSNTTGQPNGHFGPVNGSIERDFIPSPRAVHVRRVSAHTTNTGEPNFGHDNEMVPIGSGNAVVPSRLLNDIDWTSYSTATRQLLQAVFPRRVLATHSLTGKQSPAFMNKPPKKRLDPHVVNDIVDTVAERCGVSKRLVRCSITIKCTDESKLYRNRQQYRHARLENHNQENVPPAAMSSDESSTVTD